MKAYCDVEMRGHALSSALLIPSRSQRHKTVEVYNCILFMACYIPYYSFSCASQISHGKCVDVAPTSLY